MFIIPAFYVIIGRDILFFVNRVKDLNMTVSTNLAWSPLGQFLKVFIVGK